MVSMVALAHYIMEEIKGGGEGEGKKDGKGKRERNGKKGKESK